MKNTTFPMKWLRSSLTMKIEPYNPMPNGTCRTIKTNYYKQSLANFIRKGAFGATAVIEYEEE